MRIFESLCFILFLIILLVIGFSFWCSNFDFGEFVPAVGFLFSFLNFRKEGKEIIFYCLNFLNGFL